jgi:hypothetical protein
MKEQKNIDKLFQDKLKAFEATPNEKVWNATKVKLQKKKRKVLPIWWISSGVAAIFILGLLVFPLNDTNIKIESFPENVVTKSPKEEVEMEIQKDIEKVIVQRNKIDKKNSEIYKNSKKSITTATVLKGLFQSDKKDKKPLTNNGIIKDLQVDKFWNDAIGIAQNEKTIVVDKSKENKQEIVEKPFDIIKKEPNKSNLKTIDLLETIAENNEEEIEGKLQKKWSVASVFGIIGANSFSKTSPLDSNLDGSTKGDKSISYGVKFSYKINNKWSFQSGIHLQEMQYSNTNIAVVASNTEVSNIKFNSGNQFVLNSTTRESFDAGSLTLNTLSFNGNMRQNFGYIEIPLEIKYNLFETSKIETQIVTGFSSLFLNKNEVLLNTANFQNRGEANNLNDLNFSGNLGVDFSYFFNKNWSLQLNPMFKTQLNTYTKNSNGFQPYFIAVYTGINYRF